MMAVQKKINQQVTTNPVVLYMKGTPQFPQCGFSGAAIQMLKACEGPNLFTVDVLADPEIRDGIKSYANWPTIPQCYIGGEFVGGCDLLIEMYQNGELAEMVEKAAAS